MAARFCPHSQRNDFTQVQLSGVPGFEVIGYDDWSRQCKHEFAEKALQRVGHDGLDVITMTPLKIMFKTFKCVKARDATSTKRALRYLFEKELDDSLRLVQERVLRPAEVALDQRRRNPGSMTDNSAQ